jgi:hypothetical protein
VRRCKRSSALLQAKHIEAGFHVVRVVHRNKIGIDFDQLRAFVSHPRNEMELGRAGPRSRIKWLDQFDAALLYRKA